MSKVNMVTIASHRYNGVWLKAGDPFVADNQTDADELRCTGFARPDVTAAATYGTRDMKAEAPAAQDQPRTKRTYRRRDLTAEK